MNSHHDPKRPRQEDHCGGEEASAASKKPKSQDEIIKIKEENKALSRALEAKKQEWEQALEAKEREWQQALQAKEREWQQALQAKERALHISFQLILQEKERALQEKERALQAKDRMHKNRSFESLLNVSEGSIKITRLGPVFSHVHGNHPPAEGIEVKNFRLLDPDQKVLKMETGKVSLLLQEFVEQSYVESAELKFRENCTYGSEADICQFVRFALMDAISIVELEGVQFEKGELTTKLERSLFGCRPDIMVVRDKQGVGLLAVEVKQPVEKGKNLADYRKVLGHAFDHAQAMNAFGQGTRFVMITTFEESYLCSLNESDFDEEDCWEESGKSKSQDIEQTQSPPIFKTPQTKPHEESGTPQILNVVSHDSSVPSPSGSSSSPPRIPSNPSSLVETPNKTTLESVFIQDDGERLLYRSKSYKAHQLVKLVYTALKLAKKKYTESLRCIYKLSTDQQYFFRRALRVVKGKWDEKESRNTKHWWGDLHVEVGKGILSQKEPSRGSQRSANKRPIDDNDGEAYYIIGSLGHGSTSNVYHALDSSGKEVALKIYVNNFLDEKIMNNEEFEQTARDATEKEKNNLVDFYPFLEGKVDLVCIFGLCSVVMPVFAPIKTLARAKWLDAIKDVLENTFKLLKKKYKDDDVRWRHVGLYKDSHDRERCILYDLSDLEEVGSDTKFVTRHHGSFKRKCQEQQASESAAQAYN